MPTAAQRAEARRRRAQAVQLHAAGFTFEQVGERMNGISDTRAYQLWTEGLAALEREGAEQARAEENVRLLTLYRAVLPSALQGSHHHVTAAVRVLESRRRLLGLDAADETAARIAAALEVAAPLVADVLTAVIDQLGLADRRDEALGYARTELLAISGGKS